MNDRFISSNCRGRLGCLCLALLLAVGVSAQSAAFAGSAQDSVRSLYGTLVATMKDSRALGGGGRYARLAPVVVQLFDVPLMTRLSIGSYWASLNAAQRQRLTESYGRYVSAIYADRFDSYNGQKLEVTGEQPASFGVLVQSQIIKANGEPVEVDYVMRRNGAGWLISDIYLDSAISEVATRRSEFAAILKNSGVDGLIMALDRKVYSLTGTTGRSGRENRRG
jgi:phospholipid transport system substrate-binding protein